MKRLVWHRAALEDRAAIVDYIASDNLLAAVDLDSEFQLKAERACANPGLYKAGRVAGTREIVVRPHYLMVYRVTPQTVEVLRVLHTALRWPKKG